MSLSYNVSVLAREHARVLDELAQLEYAPSSLESAKTYVKDLKALVVDAEKELKAAKKAEDKEGVEAHDVKQSLFRKLSYRAVGKGAVWDAKASKEEREYLDAHEKRLKAEDHLKALKSTLREAEQSVDQLVSEVARRDALLREQQHMYSRVFDGPTPEAPQDDHLEWAVRRNEDENNLQQAALNLESQTLSALTEAKKTLDNCLHKMQECENASDYDLWGGGSAADVMENSALTAAQMYAQQFHAAFAQTKRLNPAVKSIPEIKLPKASMSDIVFDNIFTDLEQHDKIGAGLRSVKATGIELCHEINRAKERVEAAAQKAQPVAEALARARAELLEFRKNTFEAFAAQGAPPSYSQGPGPGLPQAGYTAPAGPPPQPSFPAPAGPPPSFPAGPPPPPPSFPAGSGPSFLMPEGATPVHWGSMNPYAAQLVRKSTLEMEGTDAKLYEAK
ncbi:hypothetical protein EXIGLDRAFT_832264 [Exidia glandulosa HHB12029]|uniref:Uncharacterized protein n=1 Tax=Exidia glandulosa HHB12029 TaxID=1314781 RepID=A0A165LUG0_EXIGL|nr:hypothetical protein EXIGLDRAFT_832264 [Exidia glandulosa HHB12029]